MEDKKKSGWSWSFRILVVLLAVAAIFVVETVRDTKVPTTPSEKLASGYYEHNLGAKEFSGADAHVLCNEAIKQASLDASRVDIPYTASRETSELFGFLWEREDGLKMPNAVGGVVNAVVICRVGKTSKQVDHLEINGDVIIGR